MNKNYQAAMNAPIQRDCTDGDEPHQESWGFIAESVHQAKRMAVVFCLICAAILVGFALARWLYF